MSEKEILVYVAGALEATFVLIYYSGDFLFVKTEETRIPVCNP